MHETFESFRQNALDKGYTDVIERRRASSEVVPEHSHPFDASILVVEGEMWLTAYGTTQRLRTGDRFSIGADVLHAERYGAKGTLYWVARRQWISEPREWPEDDRS